MCIMEYYSATRGNSTFSNSVDGPEGIMLSVIRQTERDKHRVLSLLCGIYIKLRETESRTVVARAGGWGQGEMLVQGYTLSIIR